MSWSAWEACMFNGSDVALVVSDDCQIMKAVNRFRFIMIFITVSA